MKVGDLIEWAWWSASPSGNYSEQYTVYRGIIVSDRYEMGRHILIVVDSIGPVEVAASEAEVISDSR